MTPLLAVALSFAPWAPAVEARAAHAAHSSTATAAASAPLSGVPADARAHGFIDGTAAMGTMRTLWRAPGRGSDEAPVSGWLQVRGTASGVFAVTIGRSVIVQAAAPSPRSGTGWNDGLARELEVRALRVLHPALGLILVESTRDEDAAELAARLAQAVHDGRIAQAYPNIGIPHRYASVTVPPDDPRYGGQLYLDELDIEDAWRLGTGSADVSVLVADNGCDLLHPDLVAKLDPGFDPFDDDGDPSYEPGAGSEHGTACAGIVAAATDNGTDIAGTCPECRLRCARLLAADGEPVTVASDVLTFAFAREADVDVVSNSWGFVEAVAVPTPLKDAIVDVQQNGRGGLGAVVVFASGNDSRIIGDDELLAVPGVLGVGAVNNLGELTQFSNGGRSVDVVAPTGAVTTDISGPDGADPGNVTGSFGGTSSACPIVAGVAGLLLARSPELTADEVNAALTATARQSAFATPDRDGHDDFYGFGLVQPAAALVFHDDAPLAGEDVAGCACSLAAQKKSASTEPAVLALSLWLVASLRRRGPRSSAA